MDTADNYILRAQGDQEVERLRQQVEKLTSSLQTAIAVSGPAGASTRMYAQQLADATANLRTAEQNLTRLGGGLANVSRSGVQGMQSLAYILDDLQYVGEQGLRPIINNIAMIAPGVAVGLLALQTLKGAVGLVADQFKDSGIGEFTSEVEKLKAKVDDLAGSWFQTAQTIRETVTARQELAAAEAAAKTRETPGQVQAGAARTFQGAVSTAGGSAVAGLVEQMVSAKFAANSTDMIRQAVQSGAIDDMMARQLGIKSGKALDIQAAMENPQNAAMLRQRVVGAETNAALQRLGKGSPADLAELQAYQAQTGAGGNVLALQLRKEEIEEERKLRATIAHAENEAIKENARLRLEKLRDERELRHKIIEGEKAYQAGLDAEQTKRGRENEAADSEVIEEARRRNAAREARKQSRLERMAGGLVEAYGGEIGQAMEAGANRGEEAGDVDRRLRDQLMKRLKGSGLSEEDQLTVAAGAIENLRNQATERADMRAMTRSVFGPMADPTDQFQAMASGRMGRMGIMQAQMMSRMGMAPAGMNRRGPVGRMQVAMEQMRARMMGGRQGARLGLNATRMRVPGGSGGRGRGTPFGFRTRTPVEMLHEAARMQKEAVENFAKNVRIIL